MASKAVTKYRTRTLVVRSRGRKSGLSKITLPISVIAGLAVGLGPTLDYARQGNWANARDQLIYRYTPYDPWAKKMTMEGMKYGFFPALGGFAVHWLANKAGINRAIARAGIPILRV